MKDTTGLGWTQLTTSGHEESVLKTPGWERRKYEEDGTGGITEALQVRTALTNLYLQHVLMKR
jgi:hypothetical protein